jgi:hypothetical protein
MYTVFARVSQLRVTERRLATPAAGTEACVSELLACITDTRNKARSCIINSGKCFLHCKGTFLLHLQARRNEGTFHY